MTELTPLPLDEKNIILSFIRWIYFYINKDEKHNFERQKHILYQTSCDIGSKFKTFRDNFPKKLINNILDRFVLNYKC